MGVLDNLKSMFGGGPRTDVRARYEFLRAAVSGTMSEFHMARDRQTGQVVGLKILDPEKTKVFEARFPGLKKPSEGAILADLSHPNIVKCLEFGTTVQGEPYLVMEFVEGPGLNSLLIGKSRLLDGRRVGIIRQAATALAAVHKAGYIHRDICPRNFIISPDGSHVKLIDFGLTVPATEPFMQPGNRTGTPNYMAPELVRRKHTDQRLDVFAFGVTAYEVCTFELPWERGTTGQIAMTHANQPAIEIERRRPQIHPKLAEAIASCIERDVAKRCPSMEEFLRRILKVESEDVAA